MDNRDKVYLQKDYMRLKSIHRDLVWMTLGASEPHYEILKSIIPSVKESLEIMKQLIEKEG